jgi:ferric-dicitrate binding protein FerR (iron transport regulator)
MAYDDEASLKTTLLEGSVRFVSGNNAGLLKPGQQSQLTKDGQVKVISGVDVDEVMAWKNGVFYFKNANIETVMRELSRWYDMDIEYQGEIKTKKFGGEIQRDLNLSEVLEGLKETGIHFRIEGKKLIVLP